MLSEVGKARDVRRLAAGPLRAQVERDEKQREGTGEQKLAAQSTASAQKHSAQLRSGEEGEAARTPRDAQQHPLAALVPVHVSAVACPEEAGPARLRLEPG